MEKYNCDNFDYLASLYIDNMLESSEKSAFEAHLAECGVCNKKFESLRNIVDVCRCSEESALPNGFSEELHKKLSGVKKTDKFSWMLNKRLLHLFQLLQYYC
jgi:anti-sigma factor RsiW